MKSIIEYIFAVTDVLIIVNKNANWNLLPNLAYNACGTENIDAFVKYLDDFNNQLTNHPNERESLNEQLDHNSDNENSNVPVHSNTENPVAVTTIID